MCVYMYPHQHYLTSALKMYFVLCLSRATVKPLYNIYSQFIFLCMCLIADFGI